MLRERGVVVLGPSPRDLIDPVSPSDLRRTVVGVLQEFWAVQLDDSKFLQPRKYQAFAVLTMYRALHTLDCGAVVSKPAAARWAIGALGERWTADDRARAPGPTARSPTVSTRRALIRYTLEGV